MTPTETQLLIEQNRVTHEMIRSLHADFRDHIKRDEELYPLVAKHERVVKYTWIASRWTLATLVTSAMAYLGFK